MKAKLKEIRTWVPHKEKPTGREKYSPDSSMRLYVGNWMAGYITPITTEPEELFKFIPERLLIYMDHTDILSTETIGRKQGKPLQDIINDVEAVLTTFLNQICV